MHSLRKKLWSDIVRTREVVWVGVVIGLIVNIVAGIALALID